MTQSPGPATILHLGLGSFHRAHQAVYLHRLMAAGDRSRRLAAGNIRPDMETIAPAGERDCTRIASLAEVLPFRDDLADLVRIGADPATRIISFAVTEAGCYLDPANRPDPSLADLAADMAAAKAGQSGRTIYGALAAILAARRAASAGPVTLLCCDNLRHNGDRSRSGLLGFLDLVGKADLKAWVAVNTTAPRRPAGAARRSSRTTARPRQP